MYIFRSCRTARTAAVAVAVAAMAVGLLAGCGSVSPGRATPSTDASTVVDAGLPAATVEPAASVAAIPVEATGPANGNATTPPAQVSRGSAPTRSFPVGTRQLTLNRGADRPLRTVVWYPATGSSGGAVKSNVAAAAGRFPLVIFSHGLTSSPEAMQGVTTKLAAAGFVVAASAYPFTSNGAASFNAGDMANQPADASTVITQMLKLDTKAGDPLAGHLDTARVGAGGHSAGGFTTAGMLSGDSRDNRVKAGIIISGGAMGGPFRGAATPVLFIHGDRDSVVAYAKGRTAYDKLTWPKAFVTIIGGDHIAPVAQAASLKTMIDFLRWTLYGDEAAKTRLPSDATVSGKSRYEASW